MSYIDTCAAVEISFPSIGSVATGRLHASEIKGLIKGLQGLLV